uniref:DNA pilot protein n=1 Tax=Dulem virus 170 TaxID=3145647 RepID=A0AAU8B9E9_9VIRU
MSLSTVGIANPSGQSNGAISEFVTSPAGQAYLNSAQAASQAGSGAVDVAASDPVYGQLGDAASYIDYLAGVTAQNNAISQANAREQMQFQREQNAIAMAFNALEANKSRDWQAFMSNTAHQREVRDLIAAGLNPVLAANNGASTPSGATASGVTSSGAMGNVDTSLSGAVASLVGTVVGAKAQLDVANTNAKTNLEIAKLNQETQKYLGELSARTSVYATDKGYESSRYAADMSYGASRYASDMSKMIADLQSATSYGINSANIANELYMKQNYPSTPFQAITSSMNAKAEANDEGSLYNSTKNMYSFYSSIDMIVDFVNTLFGRG